MLHVQKLDRDWEFRRRGDAPRTAWVTVELPHSPFYTDRDGHGHWQGECEYRRTLHVPDPRPDVRYALYVGAAMHTVRVMIDDTEIGRHEGGYLPFEIDLSDHLRTGQPRRLTLALDNRDAADVPPGKPLRELDFCWFGGLYRDVELRAYPPVHITEPVAAGEVAGGGVFVRTLDATEAVARIGVRVHVRNAAGEPADGVIEVVWSGGSPAGTTRAEQAVLLPPRAATQVELELEVRAPRLWCPEDPALGIVRVIVRAVDGTIWDERRVRFGIRRIAFSRSGGFVLNGRRRRLRGTNRHQEYPYMGYAVPAAAERRDARRIKEAGFDYVRLSHYPQSPAFLEACDELGLVVMNAIPGWQFLGGERFRAACFENARQLIRRDRNHPCVVLWELSLNETMMDDAFMARLHAIGHEEYPGDQMFTCGWIDRYDVFIHSRQHGGIHTWKNGDKALVVAEYGDWEFYASSAGFNQTTGVGLHAAWSNSRQFRAAGERGLRQQARNHVAALNDTLASPAVLDGQWSVFDYVRGYHPLRAGCGVMDSFRLPKFSYYFYRSQRHPSEGGAGWSGGPVVFIASHWTARSHLRILVFSNCDEVELSLNGRSFGRRAPARAAATSSLPHPPFVFDLPQFEPGLVEATGWIGEHAAARHRVATPQAPAQLVIELDEAGISADPGQPDLLMAHARIGDAQGTLDVDEFARVTFSLEGDAALVGPACVEAEAGIASVVLRLPRGAAAFVLRAAVVVGSLSLTAAHEWRAPHAAAEPVREARAV